MTDHPSHEPIPLRPGFGKGTSFEIEDARSPAQREADLGAQYRAAGRQMAQDWLGLIDQLHDACNRVCGAESLPEGVRDLADKLRRPLIAAGLNATSILERSKP